MCHCSGYGAGDVGWLNHRGYAMYAWRDGWRRATQVSEDTRNYLFRSAADEIAAAKPLA